MATHKFNKGTSWKSMQFTHPHVSKYFLYGHNKGYQHVSTTTSPPCQANVEPPKIPNRSVYPPSNFLHSIIHPYHPCHDLIPSTFIPTQFSPQLYSSIHLVLQIPRALRFGCGCWDWWPNAWLVGCEDRETLFFLVKVLLFCRCSLGAIEGWSGVPVDWSRIRQNQFMGLI